MRHYHYSLSTYLHLLPPYTVAPTLLSVPVCCASRLGFIIDYLSHAAVTGFMAGAAITIGLSQLKNFLGYKSPAPSQTNIIAILSYVFDNTDEVRPTL